MNKKIKYKEEDLGQLKIRKEENGRRSAYVLPKAGTLKKPSHDLVRAKEEIKN